MDNYFTSIPLFSILRKENISAAGTTRPSSMDFPALLTVLRENWSTKLDWGTTVAVVVDGVLCIGWQDSNFVLGLSTVHTVHEASSLVTSKRNRPGATSTNIKITREVFGDSPFKFLEIPSFIDDYNHYMNSVNLANQYRQAYDTQKIAYRIWIPLLHWVLDQAAINAYKLASVGEAWLESHVEFRRELYRKLLDHSKLLEPQRWREPGPHNWVVRPKRQSCAMCCKKEKLRKKVLEQHRDSGIELLIAQPKVKRPEKSWSGCDFCDVPLCKTSSCFEDWHSQKS